MAHIHTRSWRIDRRCLLRGAGAALALPWLECMQPARALARRRPGGAPPKRCVFLYVPNGVNTLDWQIERAGADYALSASLQPLEAHRERITPISGLHHPHGLGHAHECAKIWLTGASLEKETGEFRSTVSADQLMAAATRAQTRFASLELTVTGGSLAWSADGVSLPAERKTSVVFERLFGAPPGGTERTRARLRRRASVLDLVRDDAVRVRRSIGSSDRTKLDEYLSAVREVELRTERADAWLDTPKPHVDAATREHLTRNIPDASAGDYYRTLYDLITLALRTDMTRVVTCMTGSESHGLALPEIGIGQTRHELSHHNGRPEQMRQLTAADTFLSEQLAYFLDRLQECREDDRSLLDQTMVLYGSGMSYGHSHGNANLPTVLAGGTALGLRHGRHIDYNLPHLGSYDLSDVQGYYAHCVRPVDADARLANLLLTLLQRMDVDASSFADSLRPLSELTG